MSPSRRLRSLREKTWWVSAQSIINALTIGVIVAIFLFEGLVKDVSKESQELLRSSDGELVSPNFESFGVNLNLRKSTEEITGVEVHGTSQKYAHMSDKTLRNSSEHSEHIVASANKASIRNKNITKASSEAQSLSVNTDGSSVKNTRSTVILADKHAKVMTSSISNGRKNDLDADLGGSLQNAEERAANDSVRKQETPKLGRSDNAIDSGQINLHLKDRIQPVSPDISHTIHANSTLNTSFHFQGVRENTENSHLFKVENITHLSYMLYRLIITHKFSSLLDVPCTTSTQWMSGLLQRLEFEIPRFHYRCVVPDDDGLVDAVLRYKDISSAVAVKEANYWGLKLPAADLAFLWYGVGFMSPKESWMLLKALRKAGTKYAIVPNNPDIARNSAQKTEHGHVNVRRAPYLFDEPLRLVNNISTTSVRKQLLMYNLANIRSDSA